MGPCDLFLMEITKDDVIGSTTEHQRVEIPVWSQRMKQQLADKNAEGKVDSSDSLK